MSEKTQHNNILLAVLCFTAVVGIVALIGFLTIGNEEEVIQGQVEVTEYRVSSKVPGRILELCVKEGDYVKKGDTLLILESMKMENPILAEQDGKVAQVAVAAGQTVMQDDLLVVLA